MRPGDRALRAKTGGRFHEQAPPELAITLLGQAREDEVTRVVEEENAIAVTGEVRVAIVAAGGLAGIPHFPARGRVEAGQAAVAQDGVEKIILVKQRRRNGCGGLRV